MEANAECVKSLTSPRATATLPALVSGHLCGPKGAIRGGRERLQIEVTVRHKSIAADMRTRADEKARRLLKYYDKIQSISVVLNKDGGGFSCEMIADLEHSSDLVAQTTGHNMPAVIDQAEERLERQLLEHKNRTRHRKGRGPNPHQPTRT